MVQRASTKSKRPTRRPAATRVAREDSGDRSSSRVKALERDRDRLTAQLQEAHERIARLEESRAEAVNRIDWVIDSLHNVLEKGA
jgi:uncharacterized coiled-coil DUF342 family protein